MPPIIYGDGEQSRDFVYIEDVVSSNLILADNSFTQIYNVGSGKSITVNKMAEFIINVLGSKTSPNHQKARAGEIKHTLASISRINTLGYKPEWSLNQGLSATITAFKQSNKPF